MPLRIAEWRHLAALDITESVMPHPPSYSLLLVIIAIIVIGVLIFLGYGDPRFALGLLLSGTVVLAIVIWRMRD